MFALKGKWSLFKMSPKDPICTPPRLLSVFERILQIDKCFKILVIFYSYPPFETIGDIKKLELDFFRRSPNDPTIYFKSLKEFPKITSVASQSRTPNIKIWEAMGSK